MGASISIYLDTRIKKTDTDNVYPVKVRATYNRERLYLGIDKARVNNILSGSQLEKFRYDGKGNYSINKDTFNDAMKVKKAGMLKELQTVFRGIELDAQRIADSIDPFTLEVFKARMSKRKTKENRVFLQFDELIDELKASDRIGTATSYKNAATSLKKFTGGKDVSFEYFTKDRLDKYKTWMQTGDHSNSDTTVGIYLRAFRTLFNRAIEAGITTQYPFTKGKERGKDKFKIPKGKGRNLALNKPDLQMIFDYVLPEKHPYCFYLDCWKLLYLMGGLNPTDLCMLRESNIQNGLIYFYRQKTRRTSNEPKEIKVPYSESVKTIVDKWKQTDIKDPYLIPVINESMDATKRKAVIGQFVKMVNTAMKAVGDDLKISLRITTYVARHSIATQLLRSGASVKFIGDQLGHHDTKTTEAYLEGFEDEQIRKAFNNATKF
ncbi:MAG: hypothetical protein A2066_08055 [Bacteroidetes bacterium GWB2_41_8]|nr:MAG: hypothetical protein A2066_08055 [Bacteroidetes bacterium GWB2_41_8]